MNGGAPGPGGEAQQGEPRIGQAIGWYDEMARHTHEPGVELQLAILEGEAGRLPRLREKLDAWEVRPDPYPAMAAVVIVSDAIATSAATTAARVGPGQPGGPARLFVPFTTRMRPADAARSDRCRTAPPRCPWRPLRESRKAT